jgi:uncharacterized protein (TIGR02646 family)
MDMLCGRARSGSLIPVQPHPEPANFDLKVRQPGQRFLSSNPHPRDWTNQEYWREVNGEFHELYGGICAYCAHWMSRDVSISTIDHYQPKSRRPDLAYDWSNFRLAAPRYNSRKGTHQDVLDPFLIQEDWFVLEIPSLMVRPNAVLPPKIADQVQKTIDRLRLCDQISVKARLDWIGPFRDGDCSIRLLERRAPFLAYELKRQGLDDANLLRQRFKQRW